MTREPTTYEILIFFALCGVALDLFLMAIGHNGAAAAFGIFGSVCAFAALMSARKARKP